MDMVQFGVERKRRSIIICWRTTKAVCPALAHAPVRKNVNIWICAITFSITGQETDAMVAKV